MITKFIDEFNANKEELENIFSQKHPESYMEIVKAVVEVLHNSEGYASIDPNRIHEIDDGDYQGNLLYIIGADDYQPSKYWYVMVAYGSCSGCDTLQGICDYSSGPPTTGQVKDYLTLALHIVQGLTEITDD